MATRTAAPSGRRLDIQGLRAVAVGLVVADHLVGRPVGGFLGVDVFFVISGFLITGLLLDDVARHGRLDLGAFYLRRARRILPAALLVLVVTLGATRLLLLDDRFRAALTDSGWASVFLLNWHQAAGGTDYFQSLLPPSPVQHYWSLAIEEQFYLGWPLLLLAVAYLAGRGRRPTGRATRAGAAALAGVVLAASLTWAWVETAESPTAAYFSTATRVWEIAAGALLAAVAPRLRHLPTWSRNALGATGLVGITVACLVVDEAAAVPAPAMILPVAATVLVLASGVGGAPVAATAVLRLPPLVYLGEISFAVYLWHWPVIVLAPAVTGAWTATEQLGALALTLVLAVVTHHLVEDPLHRTGRPRTAPAPRLAVPPRVALATLGLVAAAFVVVLLVPTVGTPAPPVTAAAPATAPAAPASPGGAARPDPLVPIRAGLEAALAAASFPALDPPLDDVVDQGINPEMEPGSDCLNPSSLTDPDLCVHGSGPRRAMVVGDSVAISWMPALEGALGDAWTLRGYALSNCPFGDVRIAIFDDPEGAARCNDSRATLYAQIRAARPDLVVVSGLEIGIQRLEGAPADADQVWARGLADAIRAVSSPTTRVVVLSPPPAGHAVGECVTRFSTPGDCVGPPSPAWVETAAAERAGATDAGATYVDTSPWFCVDQQCPIFSGTTTIRWDLAHVTRQYSALLVPVLRQALRPLLS